ncbi:hypothetical protein [Microlunatus parietis]|uniref:Uncharacterized protein n=1 Tax=Microlunatus parietis TaxID=682979 RepID=A0A7Y9I697_9ACTN|nr:hypothetical protein [Microlunatus parietis]NYE71073.1 hypothetical protein [Microlunatus parietis]
MSSALLARVGLGRIAAVVCALAAAGFVVLMIFDLGETAPGMPMAPRPVAALGALAAAVLIFLIRERTRPALLITTLVALLIMAAGSAAAIPYTGLMMIIMTIGLVTQASGPFVLDPPVITMITHLVTAIAAFLGGAWLLGRWRAARGLCPSCGRVEASVQPGRSRWVPILAAVAVVGALPYGLLKLAWAVGLRIGLPGHSFDSVSFASPGFGDTAALTGLSIVASVLMGLRLRQRLVRLGLIIVGTVGSFMLVPVGVIGAVIGLIPAALGLRQIGDAEIAGWAYAVVYGSFAVWGVGLCLLTIHYARGTRPDCRTHRATAAADAGRLEPVAPNPA